MFLSTLYLSNSRSIDGGRAFSTLEIWSCVFQSRLFHPCDFVPRFPVLRFPPPYFSWSRVFQFRVFSDPRFTLLTAFHRICLLRNCEVATRRTCTGSTQLLGRKPNRYADRKMRSIVTDAQWPVCIVVYVCICVFVWWCVVSYHIE